MRQQTVCVSFPESPRDEGLNGVLVLSVIFIVTVLVVLWSLGLFDGDDYLAPSPEETPSSPAEDEQPPAQIEVQASAPGVGIGEAQTSGCEDGQQDAACAADCQALLAEIKALKEMTANLEMALAAATLEQGIQEAAEEVQCSETRKGASPGQYTENQAMTAILWKLIVFEAAALLILFCLVLYLLFRRRR